VSGFEVLAVAGILLIVLSFASLIGGDEGVFWVLLFIGFVMTAIGIGGQQQKVSDEKATKAERKIDQYVQTKGYSVTDVHKDHNDGWTVAATDSRGVTVALHVVEVNGTFYIVNTVNTK
jgi:hypothetical protein